MGRQRSPKPAATPSKPVQETGVDHLAEILAAVRENAQRMESLVGAVIGLQTIVTQDLSARDESSAAVSGRSEFADDQTEVLQSQIDRLTEQLISTIEDRDHLSQRCDELTSRNEALNALNPGATARQQIEKMEADSLCWEDRKAIILRQMENDSFDADAFVMTLAGERMEKSDRDAASENPIHFVQSKTSGNEMKSINCNECLKKDHRS
jgi:hypothetical protein